MRIVKNLKWQVIIRKSSLVLDIKKPNNKNVKKYN